MKSEVAEIKNGMKKKRTRPGVHRSWVGHEKIRIELEVAARRVKAAYDALPPVSNRTFFQHTVKSMNNLPAHPEFKELGEAFNEMNRLKTEAVHFHGLSIHLIRLVTSPILNPDNTGDEQILNKAFKMVE